MNQKLLILGAGGHGRVCADIAESMQKYEEIVFLDDQDHSKTMERYGIIGRIQNLDRFIVPNWDYFVGIGNNTHRERFVEYLLQRRCSIANLVHSSAIVCKSATLIGVGSLLCEGVIVKSNAIIHKGSIINTGTIVEHDCEVGQYVHLSPNVTLGGTVSVGKNSWIGIGATIINNIRVGDNCVVGAGSVVIHNVQSDSKVVGVPHRQIN